MEGVDVSRRLPALPLMARTFFLMTGPCPRSLWPREAADRRRDEATRRAAMTVSTA
jgi:hypothetical protein